MSLIESKLSIKLIYLLLITYLYQVLLDVDVTK
jgi:hypothetical protein